MGGAILLDYEEFNGKSYVPSETYDEVIYRLRNANDKTESQKKEIEDMREHIECLKVELSDIQSERAILKEPIRVADKLIHATRSGINFLGMSVNTMFFSKSELRQIAEHLLVYCNNYEDGERS